MYTSYGHQTALDAGFMTLHEDKGASIDTAATVSLRFLTLRSHHSATLRSAVGFDTYLEATTYPRRSRTTMLPSDDRFTRSRQQRIRHES